MARLAQLVTRIRAWWADRPEAYRGGVPYRGLCPWCATPVYHAHPWWTSNPARDPQARPLHDGCAPLYFGWPLPPGDDAA